MERINRERDRLLQRTARVFGLGFTALALTYLTLPGTVQPRTLLLTLPLFAILAFSQYRSGVTGWIPWAAFTVLSGLGIILLVRLADEEPLTLGESTAIAQIAAGSISSTAIALTLTLIRMVLLVFTFAVTLSVTTVALVDAPHTKITIAFVTFGWITAFLLGAWLNNSVRRASRRITNIGRAHRVEREASETEAQRRQGARLLHDTVLATLTLLAHSGFGVTESALRQQAADDARLLRQLRLGGTPVPQASGGYTLEPVEESVLGNTLESVKQRFGRMGLEVSWHGTGQVLLPSDILDAFLLSLAECLENVRRHSGVTVAHVTITDDDTTVRAMVTDSGVGFMIGNIDQAKLGFKESVVARLREVGGNARLFSAPGSGTTVVLEVPK